MKNPILKIFRDPIYENTMILSRVAKERGVELWGVTKGLCGAPELGRIFIEGGCTGLADSRLDNIRKQKNSGLSCKFLLIRIPMPGEIEEILELTDSTLISSGRSLSLLEEECRLKKKNYKVIIMVEAGDLREGIMADELMKMKEQLKGLDRVRIAGAGTNLGCFGGILPSVENLSHVVRCSEIIEEMVGYPLETISIGGTTSVPMLHEGTLPEGINQIRAGSAMLRGAIAWEPFNWLKQETMEFSAEWVEIALKPSKPWGIPGFDAFGRTPYFDDNGTRLRGILAAGRQDIYPEGLLPFDPGIKILGASSDHLVCDLQNIHKPPEVGETATFRVNYAAMMTAATSPYVEKFFC
ncbi:MAG: alanine racemase [Synergistaceae bacterium]|nr:alanine racemase [Synergistaceae bacterium]